MIGMYPENRLKSWFMYFAFGIKILIGNLCAGVLLEVVHISRRCIFLWYKLTFVIVNNIHIMQIKRENI